MESEVKCPATECRLKVDVVLKSSDDVLFGAHSTNLEMWSSGFPPASFCDQSGLLDVVPLTEDSDVLELLLQYIHHQRQPDLRKLGFDVLSRLAEAVEKYEIFSAMEVCRIRMGEMALDHPIPVFTYAVTHGYPELADTTAPKLISVPLDKMKAILQNRSDAFFAWIQYREHWLQMLSSVFDEPSVVLHRGGRRECELWGEFHISVIKSVGGQLRHMENVKNHIESYQYLVSDCSHCQRRATMWIGSFGRQIAALPKFATLL